ncbi:MAG: ubiquinone biosynthesis regulatory protein kinase UbiB [Gammaproteobacteria bacterium]|nr:ubiquinone biosynthesis regulatory protein kinase UbiB [Gammaproteobacteria bacterium]
MKRLIYILWVAARYRLDTLIELDAMRSHRLLHWALRFFPHRLIRAGKLTKGERLKLALLELGPVFIKFGQMLSTRRDILPDELAHQLSDLQDNVPPFPNKIAIDLIETQLGGSVSNIFSNFENTPIASASIAQVYGATLNEKDQVIVKVVRPGIQETIKSDLNMLKLLAKKAEKYVPMAKQLRLKDVVLDYEATIYDELDMLSEARNTQKLRDNFPDSSLLYVPKVYWNLTSNQVITMERITGIPIGNITELHKKQVDMKVLAKKGVETFFTQVFVDNFFHADMHPGNIFVDATNPRDPSYIAVDCAIIGSLTEEDQNYVARNLLAFLNKDFQAIAELHIQSGWIPANTNIEEFTAVIRSVCEPIFAKPLAEIAFGPFLVNLFRTAQKFGMEVQPQLVLLQKTLLYIEGLGRQLYPQLDLWETAKPFMETWMSERVGPAATLKSFARYAPVLLKKLPEMPALLANAGQKLQDIEDRIVQQRIELDILKKEMVKEEKRSKRRRLIGTSLLMFSAVILWWTLTESFSSLGDTGLPTGLISAIVGMIVLSRA